MTITGIKGITNAAEGKANIIVYQNYQTTNHFSSLQQINSQRTKLLFKPNIVEKKVEVEVEKVVEKIVEKPVIQEKIIELDFTV